MDNRELYKTMAKYSWSDIHYANSFLPTDKPIQDNPNSWYIGIWTGPYKNTLCVRAAQTDEEATKYKSPPGSSLSEAITKAALLWGDTEPGALPRARCHNC
jgi:hypothetical protein